jgi:hypothetical protein
VNGQRLRCRRRRAASTMRCMGFHEHQGLHWAWNADTYIEWDDEGCSDVLAGVPWWLERY